MKYDRYDDKPVEKKVKTILDQHIKDILQSKHGEDFINTINRYKTTLKIKMYDKLRCRLKEKPSDIDNYGYYIALTIVQCLGCMDISYYFPHILALYEASKELGLDDNMVHSIGYYIPRFNSQKDPEDITDLLNTIYGQSFDFYNWKGDLVGTVLEKDKPSDEPDWNYGWSNLDRIRAKVIDCRIKNQECQAMYVAAKLKGIMLYLASSDHMYSCSDQVEENKKYSMKIKVDLKKPLSIEDEEPF